MNVTCHCQAVTFTTPTARPLALYICHCDGCKHGSGARCSTSAIFPRFDLPKGGALACYKRPLSSGHTLYCYYCEDCGTRMVHTTPGKKVFAIKGACLEGLTQDDMDKAKHIYTKSAMVPIPEAVENHYKD
jgi:hypothetical protein